MSTSPHGADGVFVQTLRGPIPAEALGQTLMHEHMIHDSSVYGGLRPMNSIVPVPEILQRIDEALTVGVSTIVDVSPKGFAPPPLLLAYLGVQTEMNIVPAIGWYCHDQVQIPHWIFPMAGGTPERVRDYLIDAATYGIDRSGVKPGIIKIASSLRAISEVEEVIFAGAALAQRETGLSITTHPAQRDGRGTGRDPQQVRS
jgi:phosphotriesterase-related protein